MNLNEAQEILNRQTHHVMDLVQLDGQTTLVISSNDYYDQNMKGFETLLKVEQVVYEDDIFCCSGCGEHDYQDDGYLYNGGIIDCEIYGINCGCLVKKQAELVETLSKQQQPIRSETRDLLGDRLTHIETFIGGMTDGRGGYFDGIYTREGQPEKVLEEFQAKHPRTKFIVVHEESGQFQTYWSLYKINRKAA